MDLTKEQRLISFLFIYKDKQLSITDCYNEIKCSYSYMKKIIHFMEKEGYLYIIKKGRKSIIHLSNKGTEIGLITTILLSAMKR